MPELANELTNKNPIKPPKRPELTQLTPDNIEVEDLPRFPGMTGWFDPPLLLKLLRRVIISDVFGQYADRRLLTAALDPVADNEHVRRSDFTGFMHPDQDGAVWIDYVSDLGDGFDATYAIATLLAQGPLHVEGLPRSLPRGSALVMGGDEVYPTAERDDYKIKMRIPYSLARPETASANGVPLFLVPGNHDWYDGLANFLAIFCREKPTDIGAWRTYQRRSYFAVKITDNWWIWGIDIALVRDMDQPQADYFVAIAKSMPHGANIILCSAEPGWYKAEKSGNSYRTLIYAARIAENAKDEQQQSKELKIPLVLSGDSHHYAHYHGAGTHYITSGGGGAFLHGTLALKEEIKARWLKKETATLKLAACYPSKGDSSRLLHGNARFGALNPELTWVISLLYLVFAFALTSRWHIDVAIIEFSVLFASLSFYSRYQEEHYSPRIFIACALHVLAHMAVIVGISWIALEVNRHVPGWFDRHWFLWAVYLALFTSTIGRWLAGKIFGYYLWLTCRYLDMHHNDAFSAMRLDSQRHFLRLRILGDTLTIYPIKLAQVPKRNQWRKNAKRAADPSASVFVAEPPMQPELIEPPIEITAEHAPSTTDVRTASLHPPQQ